MVVAATVVEGMEVDMEAAGAAVVMVADMPPMAVVAVAAERILAEAAVAAAAHRAQSPGQVVAIARRAGRTAPPIVRPIAPEIIMRVTTRRHLIAMRTIPGHSAMRTAGPTMSATR